jgi:hypothetical protein
MAGKRSAQSWPLRVKQRTREPSRAHHQPIAVVFDLMDQSGPDGGRTAFDGRQGSMKPEGRCKTMAGIGQRSYRFNRLAQPRCTTAAAPITAPGAAPSAVVGRRSQSFQTPGKSGGEAGTAALTSARAACKAASLVWSREVFSTVPPSPLSLSRTLSAVTLRTSTKSAAVPG